MISWLLHEYEAKPSKSVNNYDIIRGITGLYHDKETEINTVSSTYFILQNKIDILYYSSW